MMTFTLGLRGIAFGLLSISTLPACSSSDSSAKESMSAQANPCATRNSTYLETLTEVSGNCGSIPSAIVNVNADGTLTESTTITCASTSQTGCTARNSDCKWSANGIDFTETFETTFEQDGTSATGLLTLSGNGNGQSCTETYNVSFVRQ